MKADKEQLIRLLKTARGQLDGIVKMMEEDRYCVDVSNQLLATESILRKVNKQILHAHLHCCVKDALESGSQPEKIDEVLMLLDKMVK